MYGCGGNCVHNPSFPGLLDHEILFFPRCMICNWELGLFGTHSEKCRSRPQTLLADGERGPITPQTLLLRSERRAEERAPVWIWEQKGVAAVTKGSWTHWSTLAKRLTAFPWHLYPKWDRPHYVPLCPLQARGLRVRPLVLKTVGPLQVGTSRQLSGTRVRPLKVIPAPFQAVLSASRPPRHTQASI